MKYAYLFLLLASLGAAGQTSPEIISKATNTRPTAQAKAKPLKPYWLWGVGYECGLPTGRMRQGMNAAHNVHANALFRINALPKNLLVGVELNLGTYGTESFRLDYQQGGNRINAPVTYNSNLYQAGVQSQYAFGPRKPVHAFVYLRGGYAMMISRFTIEDPADPAACRTLDAGTVQHDRAFYWGAGAGLRFGTNRGRTDFVEISAGLVRGGNIRYINVDRMQNQNAPLTLSDGAKPVNVNFINTSTNHMHTHTVAEEFNHPLRLMNLRVSYTGRLFY